MSTPLSDPAGQSFRRVPPAERTPTPELHPPVRRPIDVPQPEDRRRRARRG